MSQLHSIAFTLAIACALPGCCQLQNVANSFSHWGETRVNCETPEACTPGCPTPCVTLQPPEGYLAEGPTFVGDTITGPAGKTAIDRMVEMNEELGELRRENEDLTQRVEIAERTIQNQGRAINTAGQELQRALSDYRDVRGQLEKWNGELESVNGQVRTTFQQHQRTLNQFENELEGILAEFDPARSTTNQDRNGEAQLDLNRLLNRSEADAATQPAVAQPDANLNPQVETLPAGDTIPPDAPSDRSSRAMPPQTFQLRPEFHHGQGLERLQLELGPHVLEGSMPTFVPSASENTTDAKPVQTSEVSLVPPRNLGR